MYSIIKKHKNVLDKYSDQLVAEGVCTKEEVAEVIGNYEQVSLLDFAFERLSSQNLEFCLTNRISSLVANSNLNQGIVDHGCVDIIIA